MSRLHGTPNSIIVRTLRPRCPPTDGYSLVVCIRRDATSARHYLSCREACATSSSSQLPVPCPPAHLSCGHGSRGRPRGTPVSPLHSTPTANPASRIPRNKVGRATRVVVVLSSQRGLAWPEHALPSLSHLRRPPHSANHALRTPGRPRSRNPEYMYTPAAGAGGGGGCPCGLWTLCAKPPTPCIPCVG